MAASSSGPIQARSQGRLMKERKMLNEQGKELADLGIWVHYDDADLTKAKALILGPAVGNKGKYHVGGTCGRSFVFNFEGG